MTPQEKRKLIRRLVGGQKPAAVALSDAIAELAEPALQEHRSCRLLAEYLRSAGFELRWPWRSLPTAFQARWGRGRPSVGLLAEYDALPDCGPRPGQHGHGCGHNLLGTASAVAAVAASQALSSRGGRGQVVVWGCPAEEIGVGKVYMARDGAFAGQDAILAWHPGENYVHRKGGSALDSLLFEFFGRAAHGDSAYRGRSALDGVILLDVAANYLREHIQEHMLIHMCILEGGRAPNIVPAYAKSWYYLRGRNRGEVDELRARMTAAARGAALATGTRVKVTPLSGTYNRLENDALSDALLANLVLFGRPEVTAGDVARARKLGIRRPEFHTELWTHVMPQKRGSSDEDNVSWLAPLSCVRVACVCRGTADHHRDYAAQVSLPYAHRGMLRAAEVLAATALDLCTDRRLLGRVGREFRRRRGSFRYDPLVPKGRKPPGARP